MNPHAKPILFVLLLMAGFANAQQEAFEPLSIDRPDVSNLPTTVLPGQFQFELGPEFARGPLSKELYLPNIVMRTGINKKSELRLSFNQLLLDSLGDRLSDNVLFISIGAKYRLVEEDGWMPSVAIQPEFSLPFGDGAHIHRDYPNYSLADYSLVLLFNNTLHQQVFVNYNAGVFWSRAGRTDWLASVSTSFLHTHRLGYYLEVYTLLEERGEYPVSLDGGLMFLLVPRIQLDAYLGNRGVDGDRFWFWGFGVGFRIDPEDLTPKSFHQIGVHH